MKAGRNNLDYMRAAAKILFLAYSKILFTLQREGKKIEYSAFQQQIRIQFPDATYAPFSRKVGSSVRMLERVEKNFKFSQRDAVIILAILSVIFSR
jgi:hypothetical protein